VGQTAQEPALGHQAAAPATVIAAVWAEHLHDAARPARLAPGVVHVEHAPAAEVAD
jgi:hypothetical protein